MFSFILKELNYQHAIQEKLTLSGIFNLQCSCKARPVQNTTVAVIHGICWYNSWITYCNIPQNDHTLFNHGLIPQISMFSCKVLMLKRSYMSSTYYVWMHRMSRSPKCSVPQHWPEMKDVAVICYESKILHCSAPERPLNIFHH